MQTRHAIGDHDQRVLESLHEAVYVVDAEGRIQFCNAALERLTGYLASAVLGRPSTDLYTPEDTSVLLAHRARAFRGERVGPLLQATLVRHDGTRLPVELSLASLTREGQVTACLAIVRDISAHKRAEGAFHASEERFQMLVEGVQDYAIYLLDPEGRVTTWNKGYVRDTC
jgi:PAS domain S-box-containing protein